MIEPIDFPTFLKIVGGTSIVSLATQIFSVFNIVIETEKTKKVLKDKSDIDEYGQTTEYTYTEKERFVIQQAENVKNHLTNILYGFVAAVFAILVYAVTSKIPYILTCNAYIISVSILSYIFLISIPSFVTFHMYKIFSIYYNISLVSINTTESDD